MSAADPSNRPVAITLRIYGALAAAFPHEFKNVYGDELLQAADDAIEPIWSRHGIAGLVRLLADIAIRLPAEYMAELRSDVRHAVRTLAASPGFTAVALISLSLGIGVATCAYSEMNGLLRDVPGVPNPGELVALHNPVSYPDYQQFRQLHDLFSDSFVYVAPVPLGVSQGGPTERIWGHLITPSYFSTLQVHPRLGRFFDEADDTRGRPPVVVVSSRFWEQHLGSDLAVIGKTLRVNGHLSTIIGVGPREFLGASPAIFPADLWLPVTSDPRLAPELGAGALDRRDLTMFQMVGRLRPGATEGSAEAELNAVAQQIAQSYGEPETQEKGHHRVQVLSGGKILPLRKQDVPFFRQFLMVLGGLLLLIAVANIANMMLARAIDRRREITVRLALGASRARLIRQLLTESVLLALGAAPPAFLFSIWVMHWFSNMKMPLPVPVQLDLAPDWRALIFTFAITSLTGVAFGLAPARRAAKTDLVSGLREGGDARVSRFRALSLRNSLTLGQIAVSVMLLLLTGYMGLGIQNTLGAQEGFDPANLYVISLDPLRDGYSAARAVTFFESVLERVKHLPEVTAACLTDTLPATIDGSPGVWISNPGAHSDTQAASYWARRHIVGREYFETAGIKIVAGRGFRRQDEAIGATAVIVSQEAARQFWNGQDAVGRRIEVRNGKASGGFGLWPGTLDYRPSVLTNGIRSYEVVGVVANVSEDLVASKSKKTAAIYFPLRPADQPSLRGVMLMVRSSPGVDEIRRVRGEIAAVDSNVTSFNASSMTEHIAQFMSTLNAASWTYAFMGLCGLILASVGLAGVTAHIAAKRAREIGIRMALGAQKRHVLGLVMKQGATLVAIGTVSGLALALAGIRALSGLFFSIASVQGYSPALLAGAPLLLAALALAACYAPARRSTRIDPAVTLRTE